MLIFAYLFPIHFYGLCLLCEYISEKNFITLA